MILEKVKSIIVEQVGIDEEEIMEEKSLIDDLGVDSLEIFEIIMALEDEFDIEIPNEDVENVKTVGDIVKYIKDKKND